VNVQVGARRFAALARAIPSTDEPALWNELVNHYGGWGDYQKLTNRTISFVNSYQLRARIKSGPYSRNHTSNIG